MPTEINDRSRKREIVDTCLQKFIEKGLYETTSRDLTDALNMTPGALYYHFKNKDDAVVKCAEEAAIRLEKRLLLPSITSLDNLDNLREQPKEELDEVQALMRFFTQVCMANKYQEQMQPVLERMRKREQAYCEKAAKKLGCSSEELAPWFFAVIASAQSYLIFGEEAYNVKTLDFIKPAIRLFQEKYTQKAMDNDDQRKISPLR